MSVAGDRVEALVKELIEAGEHPGAIASAMLNASATIVIRCGQADQFVPLATYSFEKIRPLAEKLMRIEKELKAGEPS